MTLKGPSTWPPTWAQTSGMPSLLRKTGKEKDASFWPHLSGCYSQDGPPLGSPSQMLVGVLRDQANQGSQTHKLWGQTENMSEVGWMADNKEW